MKQHLQDVYGKHTVLVRFIYNIKQKRDNKPRGINMLVPLYVLYHSPESEVRNQCSLNMQRGDTPVKSERKKRVKSAWFLAEVKR